MHTMRRPYDPIQLIIVDIDQVTKVSNSEKIVAENQFINQLILKTQMLHLKQII